MTTDVPGDTTPAEAATANNGARDEPPVGSAELRRLDQAAQDIRNANLGVARACLLELYREAWRAGRAAAGSHVTAAGRERLAETDFLAASIAVWREIDRLDAEPGGYHPVRMYDSIYALRQQERAAWERYRDLLAAVHPEGTQ